MADTETHQPQPTAEDIADNARFALYQHQQDRGEAVTRAKLKQVYSDLLRLERFALSRGGLFSQDHDHLLASIHYLQRVLWIYDREAVTDFVPHPFAHEACGLMAEDAAHKRNIARLKFLPPMSRKARKDLLAAFDLIDQTERDAFEHPHRADLRKRANAARRPKK